jgi:hypothetical protein
MQLMWIHRTVRAALALAAVMVVGEGPGGTPQLRAQVPVAVTTVPVVVGQPVVTFTPRRAGLLGLRTVYRPEVGVLLPPAVPVVSAPAPVVGTTTFFAPSAPVMVSPAPAVGTTTFFAPSAPVMVSSAPAMATTTFFAPATPTIVTPAPSAPVTTFMVPTAPVVVPSVPVTTFFAPAPLIPTQGFSNFVPGY